MGEADQRHALIIFFSPCENPALIAGDGQQKRLQPRERLLPKVAPHL